MDLTGYTERRQTVYTKCERSNTHMQKANPRELRANLKHYLESKHATVIKDARSYDPKARAVIIPIHYGTKPWDYQAQRRAIAEARKIFATAMSELNN